MEISVTGQAAAGAASLLLGGICGIIYDFLGVLRRRVGMTVVTAMLDFTFCLAVSAMIFILAVTFAGGELRLFLIVGVLLGGTLYFAYLSRIMRQLLDCAADALEFLIKSMLSPLKSAFRYLKKILKKGKNIFHYWEKGFRIYKNMYNGLSVQRKNRLMQGRTEHENQTGKYIYEAGRYGFSCLRDNIADKPSGKSYGGNRGKQPAVSAGGGKKHIK